MTTNSGRRHQSTRYCTPNCKFFRCSKRAMGYKKKVRGRMRISCNFVEGDFCTGSRCTYSFCVKHKLKTDGTCGLSKKSRRRKDDDEIERKYEKELEQKERESNTYKKHLKQKYRKKLKHKNSRW